MICSHHTYPLNIIMQSSSDVPLLQPKLGGPFGRKIVADSFQSPSWRCQKQWMPQRRSLPRQTRQSFKAKAPTVSILYVYCAFWVIAQYVSHSFTTLADLVNIQDDLGLDVLRQAPLSCFTYSNLSLRPIWRSLYELVLRIQISTFCVSIRQAKRQWTFEPLVLPTKSLCLVNHWSCEPLGHVKTFNPPNTHGTHMSWLFYMFTGKFGLNVTSTLDRCILITTHYIWCGYPHQSSSPRRFPYLKANIKRMSSYTPTMAQMCAHGLISRSGEFPHKNRSKITFVNVKYEP
jgi:hypothetical protein